ncbi:hypothetical protein D5S17_17645 [Pseudonocardiaceae bacterium YIM PH 21723]|nr:hypothetical protein D5S17_17645 [Pseudonocardiaceae bacterium YIM PH 21723]
MFTLLGAGVGALSPLTLGLLNRRSERQRLSRSQKVELYPAITGAAGRLVRLPVWPVEGNDPEPIIEELSSHLQEARFLCPPGVVGAADTVLASATELSVLITEIRTGTAGFGNTVEVRHRAGYEAAIGGLKSTVDEFVRVGRSDLEQVTVR